ncbi:MAG: tyrosine-type recombinase/integrase [Clostridia bacterium]|nr:tyrosine-type recombinase/integrase [Clostridia bacterium]
MTYQNEKQMKYTNMLRTVLKELPEFCGYFFRAAETTSSILTRYGYAVDLRSFFRFLSSGEIEWCPAKDMKSLTLSDLNKVRPLDIERYLEHISLYQDQEKKIHTNKERAKARKLAAIRSFFKYYYKQQMIDNNVSALVDTPKLHEKAIVRLDVNEVADLLDTVEQGNGLSERQQNYHEITKVRDTAILTLFLGTGIRISELVGIDMRDVDFERDQFVVTRKGGNQERLAFGPEVREALRCYLNERKDITALPGHENAFFLSLQKKRITVRAVENLVKKYAKLSTPLKKITPHKLRSTYGTMLYQESGDIYLVADVLGHKDVNTTRKHYAAISEDRRRTAAKYIKLREDEPETDQ